MIKATYPLHATIPDPCEAADVTSATFRHLVHGLLVAEDELPPQSQLEGCCIPFMLLQGTRETLRLLPSSNVEIHISYHRQACPVVGCSKISAASLPQQRISVTAHGKIECEGRMSY